MIICDDIDIMESKGELKRELKRELKGELKRELKGELKVFWEADKILGDCFLEEMMVQLIAGLGDRLTTAILV